MPCHGNGMHATLPAVPLSFFRRFLLRLPAASQSSQQLPYLEGGRGQRQRHLVLRRQADDCRAEEEVHRGSLLDTARECEWLN